MTTVVSWISKEREFPTLWVAADSRLSNLSTGESVIIKPLLNCAAKLFSIRVICIQQEDNGQILDNIYYSTTIGMAYAGNSLLGMNLHAFIGYTLGNLSGKTTEKPSMKQISEHVFASFNSILFNYIDTKLESSPIEISIFGYCPTEQKHQLFHVHHNGKGRDATCNEFEFIDINSIHLMGSNKENILNKIILDRREIHSDQGTNSRFWRFPLSTIKTLIKNESYNDIGGKVQLGIGYPRGFKLTPIYEPDFMAKYFRRKCKPSLIYQGVDLYSDQALTKIGDCSVETDSILIE